MAIPREYATSNPVVRDRLALIPIAAGNRVGDFVSPDERIDAETVDTVTTATHSLELDDLRAADAEAKMVRFESGTVATISVVERALKARIDSRKIEEAGTRGVDVLAERSSLLREDILDAKEYRKAAIVTTTASFAASHKGSGANYRTLDLQARIDGYKQVILDDGGFDARYGLIGPTAWRYVQQNATFQAFVNPGGAVNGRRANLADLAAFLDLDEVRLARYGRLLGANATTATAFWPADFFLLFAKNTGSVTNRTFSATPVVPYGAAQARSGVQGAGSGDVDVRVATIQGTELLTEYGAYHRYRALLTNASLGAIDTGIIGS